MPSFDLHRASLFVIGTVLVIGLTSTRALAHEGHDHGAPPTPVSATIAPRADASSSDFEMVAVARNGQLTIYLDTYKDNAPVVNAEIEIDTPAGLLKPTAAQEAGTYAVAAPFLKSPGSYDLAVTVTANGSVDVLAATLKIPQPPGDTGTVVG